MKSTLLLIAINLLALTGQAQVIEPQPRARQTQPISEKSVGPPMAAQANSRVKAVAHSYDTVANDPFKARIYSLRNGLKVYISVNKDAPRIQTLFAVKAGSKFDPAQTTGLAHYLEHMMFKGSH